MKVVVVRYNAGNVRSVLFAFNRIGVEPLWTDDREEILSADRVVFPGVGEASSAMRYLEERGLDNVLRGVRAPFLGICLGLQLMCSHSEENNTPCLNIFPQQVVRFQTELKVPHIGWNAVSPAQLPLFTGVADGAHFYFVHSYHAEVSGYTAAETDYGVRFSSALRRDNFFGVQFHPEKSGGVGERVLRNFLEFGEHV